MISIAVKISKKTNAISRKRLQYVINNLNDFVAAQNIGINFSLKEESNTSDKIYTLDTEERAFTIPIQSEIFANKTNLKVNSYSFSSENLYSVEAKTNKEKPFLSDKSFGFDIFETLFFHWSRYEERYIKQGNYLGKKLDFEKQLLLVKSGLEKIPVVDDLIKAFLECITRKKIQIETPISLSHDIDYIQMFKSPASIFRKIGGHIKHRKPISTFPILLKRYKDYLIEGRDPFDTFEWMLSKKDMSKSIYFLLGGTHKDDNEYDLNNPIFKKAVKLARERNYRIGIHPSYESWEKKDLIRTQKEKLENEVGHEIVISRQHFLNFDIEITPRLLQQTGIREDSSLGYTRYVGYRCGTGFPYRLYDFENERAFDVVERPLVFMDSSWWFEQQRKENSDITISDYYGMYNFHNSFFYEMATRGKNLAFWYNDLII